MGVTGLDLCWQSVSGMPGKPGWPRYQSRQNTNANDTIADLAEAIANGVSAPETVSVG